MQEIENFFCKWKTPRSTRRVDLIQVRKFQKIGFTQLGRTIAQLMQIDDSST